MTDAQRAYEPSHPGLFEVAFAAGDYNSTLRAVKGFNSGQLITKLEGASRSPKAYSTVQCGPGPDDHIELNSDLRYVNHSCEPNVAFDLSSPVMSDWHVRALRDILPGETLTFFYPSTEWAMGQPFRCGCAAKTCLGTIEGARMLPRAELERRQFVNFWIQELVARREMDGMTSSAN